MNNRIMILGSLGEFTELTKKAAARGIYTIVCDGNPNGEAKNFADKSYDIDVTDIDAIADVCKKENVDGIITAFSDLLLECMVKICDKAGLPCYLNTAQLPYYRDKSIMKQMFNELGIKTPKFFSLREDFKASISSDFKFPAVAKPVDKYGSRGITIVNGIDEAKRNFCEVCDSSERKEILLEEYNDGYEFNAMSWLDDGRLTILGIADREKTQIAAGEIPISTRNVYPTRFYKELKTEVEDVLNKIAAYTGQKNGELSMQFFWKPDEQISVGEVAARFLGYEHELIEFAGGFSIEELLLNSVYDKAAMKKMLEAHDASMKKCAAVIYFQPKNGIVENTEAFSNAIKDISEVVSSELFYKKGDVSALYARPYAARVCICCDTRSEADEVSKHIIDRAAIYDKCGNNLLYKNVLQEYGF